MDDRLIRLKDVLTHVKVASSTWRKWCKDGKAPSPQKHGGSTFWRESDIKTFIAGTWAPPQSHQGNQPTPAS